MQSKEFGTDTSKVQKMLNDAETARMKGRIVSSASGLAVKVLGSITGDMGVHIVGHDASNLVGDRNFSGTLRIEASVRQEGIEKIINIPFIVEKSVVKSPDTYIIKKKLASIQPKTSRHLGEEERLTKNMADLKEKEAAIVKEETEFIKGSPILDKEAKEINIPSGGVSTSEKDLVKSMQYDKINLPLDTEVDDTISLNGRTRKVSEGVGDFGQPSTKWNLTLVEESK